MLQVTVTLDKSDEFDVIENKTGHITFKSIEVVNNIQVNDDRCTYGEPYLFHLYYYIWKYEHNVSWQSYSLTSKVNNKQECLLLLKVDDNDLGFRLKPVTSSRCSFQLSQESSERLSSP